MTEQQIDRDRLRALADEYDDSTIDGGPDMAAGAIRQLLDALDQAEAERDRQRAFKNEAHRFADRVIQEVADAAGIRVADDGWALDDITAAIRQARTDHARAQVDRVRALHQHGGSTFGDGLEDYTPVCADCLEEWPCPTIRALDGEQ